MVVDHYNLRRKRLAGNTWGIKCILLAKRIESIVQLLGCFMAETLTQRGRQIAYKIITFQLISSGLIGLMATFFSYNAGISVVLGGLACVLPSALFALIVFRNVGAQKSKSVVRSFYAGEAIKFLLTLVLFLLIFKYVDILPGLVILGYSIALIANWLAIGRLKAAQF